MPDRHARARRHVAAAALFVLPYAAATVAALAAAPAPAEMPRSKDDRGFTIALVSPSDPYLTGRQTLRIEAIIPRGDSIEEVDFFADGRLLLVAQGEPFECSHDFGADIHRHLLEVRALTHQGRRAKVSFVSRSVDVKEGAVGPMATIAAVVRDTAGRPVGLLGVSDFVLTEDTQRRSIVHFGTGPAPAALAIVLDSRARASAPAETLTSFLRDLPEHQVVTLVGGPAVESAPAGGGGSDTPGPAGKDATAGGATTAGSATTPASGWQSPADLCTALQNGLGERAGTTAADLDAAASLLEARREPRVLLFIVTLEPEPAPVPEAAPEDAVVERPAPSTPRMKPPHTATPLPAAPAPSADDLLAAGLESVLRTRAVLYVIGVGPSDSRVPQTLRDMTVRSGGQFLLAPDLALVPQALRSLTETLRNRYLITFMPAEPGKAGWHAIDLAVSQSDLAVQAPKTLAFP